MVPQAQFDRVQVDCQSLLMQLDLWPSAVSRESLIVSEIYSVWSSAAVLGYLECLV